MIAKAVERIGLIVAGAGAGSLIAAGMGVAKVGLVLGLLAAGGAYGYERYLASEKQGS